jgi:hypothetical protein
MPKKILAAALLLGLCAAARAQQAMLWIPADGKPAPEILSLLESDKALRLTAAFSDLPADLAERVRKLEKDGRLELALRPAGDPPLPLLYGAAAPEVKWAGKPSTATLPSDQYFMGLRIGLAREAALKDLKKVPAGFVSVPGGLSPDYFPLARAMGVKWLACGPLASTAAAALSADGVYAVPFVPASTRTAVAPPLFVVFDETAVPDPAPLRAQLAAELAPSSPVRRVTVSEALAQVVVATASPAEASALAAPWSGDYTPWASAPGQAGALAAFARTRADLMLHLNSQQGNYKQAAGPFEEYFSAEAGPGLRALGDAGTTAAQEREAEIQASLANAYRLMQRTPPPWVFSGLADASGGPERSDKLKITLKAGGFELLNVQRKPELPSSLRSPPNADPYKLWRLASLRVVPSPEDIVFYFTPEALAVPLRSKTGFGYIRLDLYIDINHRPRAGMTRPLDGRPLRFFPDNAWEYALEITPEKASLYSITPKGPIVAGTFAPKAENGEIAVRVPRAVLKGNPLLWGYAALLLAPKDDKTFAIADYAAAEIANGYIYAVRPGKK